MQGRGTADSNNPVAGNMTHGRPSATYASITREEASLRVCTSLAGFDGEDSQVMAKAPEWGGKKHKKVMFVRLLRSSVAEG